MPDKDAYLQKLHAKLDEWNAEVDKLTANAHQTESDTKIEYKNQLENLQEKSKDLEEKILALEHAGDSAWEDLKQGIENSWEIFNKIFTKAKSEFERGYKEGKKD